MWRFRRWLRLSRRDDPPAIVRTNPGEQPGFVLLFAPSRSYRVAAYIRAAEALGYRLLIVSDSRHSLIPIIANGITVDFSRPDHARTIIAEALVDKRIIAVIATDDQVVTLASETARSLGLPHNDPQSAQLTRRKDLARQRLRENACNTPDFEIIDLARQTASHIRLDYPLVLKPLMLSGSRGVMRADNPGQLDEAILTLRGILKAEPCNDFEKTHALVESFLVGEEIALDGFVQDGDFQLLALFDKPEPMNGPFFEESYYITPSRHDAATRQAIIDEIQKCCDAYGLRHGPIHAEARITDHGVVLLEMASRTIGGQCAQLIDYVLGVALEQVVIQLMCGDQPALERRDGHAGVLMIPIPASGVLKRVEGMLKAQQVPNITNLEIHIQPGYELQPLPHGASYLGFIFARAPSFDEVWQALRESHGHLHFVTAPKWNIEAV